MFECNENVVSFVCFPLFILPSFFLSTFIIIIVQINRLQSVRVYVSFESVLTATNTHTHAHIHSHSCVLCGIIPGDKIIIFHIFIFSPFFVIILFEFKPFLPPWWEIVGRHFIFNPFYAVVESKIHHFYLLDSLCIHRSYLILGKMQMNEKCQLCICSDFFSTNQLKCNISNVYA